MEQESDGESQFVVELLTTLRAERFSAAAWGRFLGRSWEMARSTARAKPTLRRSWLRLTLFIAALGLALLLLCLLLEGPRAALRLLPGLLFFVAWQQSDLYWHLGLNRDLRTRELLPVVGLANSCTWLRALGASYLLGRLVGGLATPTWLALLAFLLGGATDILDGLIARHTETRSRLGQIADGEVDFCLYLAVTLILVQNASLPYWLALVMLLRFGVPLLAALGSYFLFAHTLRFGSTRWGKAAGLAQSLYFLTLLAPTALASVTRIIDTPLLIITLCLLVIAPMAQFGVHLRMGRKTGI